LKTLLYLINSFIIEKHKRNELRLNRDTKTVNSVGDFWVVAELRLEFWKFFWFQVGWSRTKIEIQPFRKSAMVFVIARIQQREQGGYQSLKIVIDIVSNKSNNFGIKQVLW